MQVEHAPKGKAGVRTSIRPTESLVCQTIPTGSKGPISDASVGGEKSATDGAIPKREQGKYVTTAGAQ